MKKHIYIVVILSLLAGATSCKKWLDVKPRDKVVEDDLFSSEAGFLTALNGVYLNMCDSTSYGMEMTMRFTEVLGQRYKIASDHYLYQVNNYQYKEPAVQQRISSVWRSAYANVANLNVLIDKANARRNVLSVNHYNWIKGEAMALRAFLQFDILRLFGPVYSKDSSLRCIPYYTTFSTQYNPLLKGSEAMVKILNDLDSAAILLKDEPVVTGNTDGTGWGSRRLRMNYYAVKALTARACLYRGDKASALQQAKEVIRQADVLFPFVKLNAIVGEVKNPDRVFSTELIFALRDLRLNSTYRRLFDPALPEITILYTAQSRLTTEFESNTNDYRYGNMWMQPGSNQKSYRCFYKYADVEEFSKPFRNLIPLIRVSEMYFIAAECEPDPAAALAYLNMVRKNRGISDAPPTAAMNTELQKDYRREFYGEGQMFFWYKRNATGSVPAGSGSGNVAMTASQYVVPLPDSETQYRD
ncbi:RagB/SusD family nutrient uptake outer membrane protein [Chitinophaga solisilvae]|uniref:RagB/SusD family nutrient uptake outer membrane protein n=1 Tax=Chitinophaga solisilvae TaxID=1233460 RepID=A0A433WJ07_9BACT|nr:RagB/SusD family nutrient uptake outer membrane protein [Chitinophaga solisilvae]NSL88857.1 RagB/SusD family nutrient uptake outer membrane protein [Chitinophaga solisilvae]